MICKNIVCTGCGAVLEIKVWKRFVVCPWCKTKNDFDGFEYKDISLNESMYANVKYEQDCPVCRSPHMFAYSPLGKWSCVDCGYKMSGLKKMFDVLWFCDNCETYMNVQKGFTTKHKTWVCMECGFKNSVTRKDIM